MHFIEHTINWTKGEIFEGTVIAVAGILTVLIGLVFWRYGESPGAKAMLIPLLVVGLLYAAIGTSMYFSNQKRMEQFAQAHNEDSRAFVQREQERVEGFQYMYTITLVLAPICFALATAFFWWSTNPHLRAAGIALVVFGLSGLVIDFFSKERADTYYDKIQTELSSYSVVD